jgi:hypothetical protein
MFVKTAAFTKQHVPRARVRFDSLDPPQFCRKGSRQAKAFSKKAMRVYTALPDHICDKDVWTIARFLEVRFLEVTARCGRQLLLWPGGVESRVCMFAGGA